MKHKALAFLIGVAFIWAVGCNFCRQQDRHESVTSFGEVSQPKAETVLPDRKPRVYQGFAMYGHEVRALRLCGSEEILWATDPSGMLWDLYKEMAPHEKPYEEVFVEVEGYKGVAPTEGFGADYTGELVIDAVLYIAPEGFGCETDWGNFYYRAYGNEPFWSIVISPQGIDFSRLDGPKLTWTDVRQDRLGEGVRYTGEDRHGIPIEIIITREPCRDSMSGAFFGFAATVRLRTEELRGCALKGSNSGE